MANFKIRKHKDGKYYFDLHHKTGRKRRFGFKTQKEARARALDFIKELDSGAQPTKEVIFEDYFDTWLNLNKVNHVNEKQLRWYRRAKSLFVEKYGKRKMLSTITRNDIQLLLNEYGEGRTQESVRKIKNCLSAPFKDAVYEGYITKDPTYKVQLIGTKRGKQAYEKFLKIEEYLKLIEQFKSSSALSSLMLFIIAITGARFSEVNNMTYKDFDYSPGKIWLPGTKTDTASRAVAISTEDLTHIKQVLNSRPRKLNNKPFELSHAAVGKQFKKRLKSVGVQKDVTVYALRHTHASFLIANQFDITYISHRLGHANPKTTLDTYSHLLAEQSDKQDLKLATIWQR